MMETTTEEINVATSYCVGEYSKRLEVWLKFYKPKQLRYEIEIFNGLHFHKDGSFEISTEVFVPYKYPNGVNTCQFVVLQEREKGD